MPGRSRRDEIVLVPVRLVGDDDHVPTVGQEWGISSPFWSGRNFWTVETIPPAATLRRSFRSSLGLGLNWRFDEVTRRRQRTFRRAGHQGRSDPLGPRASDWRERDFERSSRRKGHREALPAALGVPDYSHTPVPFSAAAETVACTARLTAWNWCTPRLSWKR